MCIVFIQRYIVVTPQVDRKKSNTQISRPYNSVRQIRLFHFYFPQTTTNFVSPKRRRRRNEWPLKEFTRVLTIESAFAAMPKFVHNNSPEVVRWRLITMKKRLISFLFLFRCLQVHDQFGVTLTEILKKQRSVSGGCNLGGPLRFNNSLVLWLQCDSVSFTFIRLNVFIMQGQF